MNTQFRYGAVLFQPKGADFVVLPTCDDVVHIPLFFHFLVILNLAASAVSSLRRRWFPTLNSGPSDAETGHSRRSIPLHRENLLDRFLDLRSGGVCR